MELSLQHKRSSSVSIGLQNPPHLGQLLWPNFCSLKTFLGWKKQPPEVFCKKGVLRNFAEFTGKHLCQSLFFNKVAGLFLDPSLVPKTKKINVIFMWRQVYCRYLDMMTWSITIFCSDFLVSTCVQLLLFRYLKNLKRIFKTTDTLF